MSSNVTSHCDYKTCLKSAKHYSPTQAPSSFLIQPSLQSWQSLLLEPVQVLQAAWQAERRKLQPEFCGEIPRQAQAQRFSEKTLFRIHWKPSFLVAWNSHSQDGTSIRSRFNLETCSYLIKTTAKSQNIPGNQT